ncbi:MAG: hypothetical protein LBP95_12005 [Deltaproteobacteria bacterium]|nr:hypothetical protein [Deltaproteobacteria bacterium]
MKINDLRAVLEKYDKPELKEIAVRLYKSIPKAAKESGGLDELLTDFSKGKKQTPKPPTVDFASLQVIVERFLKNVRFGFYFCPNRHVSKKKRIQWRFEARRYVKDLVDVRGDDSDAAADLMIQFYYMLSYGENVTVFNSDTPFAAIGILPVDFLELILSKLFYNGVTPAKIRTAVFFILDAMLDCGHSWASYCCELLVYALKTPETKELALEHCDAFPLEYEKFQQLKRHFEYRKGFPNYYRDRTSPAMLKNAATELRLQLKFGLFEYDEGISYFWKNYVGKNKEESLHVLLDSHLKYEDLASWWVGEYEKAVADGVSPRESLRIMYESKKKSLAKD